MNDVNKLMAVRFKAAQLRPYFATALFAHDLVPVRHPSMPHMGIDRHGRIYVNPDLIGSASANSQTESVWNVRDCALWMIRELGHWLRKHAERAEALLRAYPEVDPPTLRAVINLAQHLELNDDMEREFLGIPSLWEFPEPFGVPPHKLFEEYVQIFLDRLRAGDPDLEKQLQDRLGEHPSLEFCGSGADGAPAPWELPPPDGQSGLGGPTGDLIRRGAAQQIERLPPGAVPAGLRRWAHDQMQTAKVPWEQKLASALQQGVTIVRGASDYAWQKASRLYPLTGVILPTAVGSLPQVAVVVDTSGSMFDKQLGQCLGEVDGIARAMGQQAFPVFATDAAVHGGPQWVTGASQVQLLGGGGTDMGEGIRAALETHANVIVCVTDGDTPWPESLPHDVQLIIVLTRFRYQADDMLHCPLPTYAQEVIRVAIEEEECD